MIIIAIVIYALIASAAMWAIITWNKTYKIIDEWDIPVISTLVSIFWPFAFPVFAAYFWANVFRKSE